ncbi:phosphotransferase family protein [Altererythrobacter sp.]|uniref:phosphotransferase family protein n=1 Tax=Altererythrobacter sp. TaxID=1872480 RepID=UPI003CFF7EDD
MSISTLPIDQLGTYLESRVVGFHGLASAEKFPGGQSNPTFLLNADSGRYVLRRKPPGDLLKSAHAVDREFRVLSALKHTDVPVASPLVLCEDEDVIGSMFYVMDYVEGRVFWDQTLPGLSRDERVAIFDDLNRVLAAIHSVDVEASGLGDFGKPGNYFERQYHRWEKQYRLSETETIPAMEELIAWLGVNMVPDDGRVSLIHGDYRLDNVLLAPDAPRALAVIDWELSTLGHPFADLAYQCMQWRMPADDVARGFGDADRAALGLPDEEAYVEAYCRRMGLPGVENWTFYLAFSFFRLAAIAQGVMKRALIGNASSDRAKAIGALVHPLSSKACEVIAQEGVPC